MVHTELKHLRPNPKREFFTISKEEAVSVIQSLAQQCGGIKFEECFFPIRTALEPEQQVTLDDSQEDITENRINILDNYPNAKLVLEYNELASSMLYKLKNCPKSAVEEFYSALENTPDASNEQLEELFDRNFKSQYLEPFESFHQNFRYAFCLSKSTEMATEYLNVSKTLNKSVDNYSAFLRICEKFDIPKNDLPNVSDEFSFYLKMRFQAQLL